MGLLADAFFGTAVILATMFFVVASVSPYTDFTSESRSRACISNQNSIDKYVGVWESQEAAIPTDKDIWIDFWTDGSVARVSPDLETWMTHAGIPQRERLLPGSRVLYVYAKDPSIFSCAERVNDRGAQAFGAGPHEIHFRWWQGRPGRNGRTRGTQCLMYDRSGPPDWPDRPHHP